MNVPKAIPTLYNGYHFRSRLEARWAIYFDRAGIEYHYELEGFDLGELGRYLPDFYFPSFNCWGEVKPTTFTEIEFNKAHKIMPCLLLDTKPTEDRAFYLTDKDSSYANYLSGDDFLRVFLPMSVRKGRLWFLLGESVEDYDFVWDFSGPSAIANSARFEHGATIT